MNAVSSLYLFFPVSTILISDTNCINMLQFIAHVIYYIISTHHNMESDIFHGIFLASTGVFLD